MPDNPYEAPQEGNERETPARFLGATTQEWVAIGVILVLVALTLLPAIPAIVPYFIRLIP